MIEGRKYFLITPIVIARNEVTWQSQFSPFRFPFLTTIYYLTKKHSVLECFFLTAVERRLEVVEPVPGHQDHPYRHEDDVGPDQW